MAGNLRGNLGKVIPITLGCSSLATNFILSVVGVATIVLLVVRYVDPLQSFGALLSDVQWKRALSNTIWMFFVSMVVQITFLFWASFSIRRIPPFAKLFLIVPFTTGIAAPALSLYILFSPMLGPFTSLNVIGTPIGARILVSLIDAWQWTGILLVLAFTRLERIPISVFETSALEGIGRFAQWRSIVLPELCVLLPIYVTFKFLDWLRKIDVVNYLFSSGGPAYSVETISMYASRLYFGGRSEYAATLSLLQIAVLIVVILVVLLLTGRRSTFSQGRGND